MPNTSIALPDEFIEDTILLIRGKRVILDHDLARLYGVTTRVPNQAAQRNTDRFPEDFMFQLTKAETEEWQHIKRLRSQNVILKKTRGAHRKYQPYAFTEHGILMLSSVLKSQRAVQVNIQIMRTFVRLRQMLTSNDKLIERLDELEENYDAKFKIVFSAVRQLMNPRAGKRSQLDSVPDQLRIEQVSQIGRTNLRALVGTRSVPPVRPRAFSQAERRASAFQIPHRSWLQSGFALYSLTIAQPTDEVRGPD